MKRGKKGDQDAQEAVVTSLVNAAVIALARLGKNGKQREKRHESTHSVSPSFLFHPTNLPTNLPTSIIALLLSYPLSPYFDGNFCCFSSHCFLSPFSSTLPLLHSPYRRHNVYHSMNPDDVLYPINLPESRAWRTILGDGNLFRVSSPKVSISRRQLKLQARLVDVCDFEISVSSCSSFADSTPQAYRETRPTSLLDPTWAVASTCVCLCATLSPLAWSEDRKSRGRDFFIEPSWVSETRYSLQHLKWVNKSFFLVDLSAISSLSALSVIIKYYQSIKSYTNKWTPSCKTEKSKGKMISSQPAPRVARNVAEKQRRDKLNAFISDLATHVPLVASATKRLDKTSILRLASCFLRLVDSPLRSIAYNWTSKDIVDRGFPSSPSNTSTATIPYNSSPSPSHWKAPKFLRSDHVRTLMEGLEGFLIVANCDLKLIYVAQTCEKFLGHQNIDMMGFPLTAFIHPGDVDAAKFILETAKEDLLNSEKKESERVQVRCRMKERSQPRTEVVTYQMVQIVGTFILSNVDRDYNGFTNGQHTSSSSGINNLSVSNNNGNPTSDTNSAMNDTLPPSPCPSTSSSGIFSHCPSTSKGTKRKRGESIDSGLSELSCPSPSSSKKSCFPYSPSSVSETSCSMEFNLFPKSLSVPSPSSSSTTVIATKSDTTSDPSSPTTVMACSPSFIAKNLLFKGFVQVIPSSPMAELSLIDANQEEYVTRLSLDGVLLYADHR